MRNIRSGLKNQGLLVQTREPSGTTSRRIGSA
jgi:hypothetical protein